MGIPLLLLLVATSGTPAPAARMLSARSESISAVDVSASQRFGWVYALARAKPADAVMILRPFQPTQIGQGSALLGALRSTEDVIGATLERAPEIAMAARWIDALPFQVDAHGGGFCVAFRLHGP